MAVLMPSEALMELASTSLSTINDNIGQNSQVNGGQFLTAGASGDEFGIALRGYKANSTARRELEAQVK